MEDFEVGGEPRLRRHLQKRIRCLLNLGLFETPRALLASLGTEQLEEAVSMTMSLIEQGKLVWHVQSTALFTWLEMCDRPAIYLAGPPSGWQPSYSVPGAAHLAWLAASALIDLTADFERPETFGVTKEGILKLDFDLAAGYIGAPEETERWADAPPKGEKHCTPLRAKQHLICRTRSSILWLAGSGFSMEEKNRLIELLGSSGQVAGHESDQVSEHPAQSVLGDQDYKLLDRLVHAQPLLSRGETHEQVMVLQIAYGGRLMMGAIFACCSPPDQHP